MLRCIKNTIFSSHYPPIVATAPYLFVHTRNEFDYRINDRVSDHRTTRNLKKSFSNFSPPRMRRFFNRIHLPVSHTIPSPLPPLLFFPPFLQFLNIDRISLTNIRLARSDGDFLTKSCWKIQTYIYIYDTLSGSHVWKEGRRNGWKPRVQTSARE